MISSPHNLPFNVLPTRESLLSICIALRRYLWTYILAARVFAAHLILPRYGSLARAVISHCVLTAAKLAACTPNIYTEINFTFSRAEKSDIM